MHSALTGGRPRRGKGQGAHGEEEDCAQKDVGGMTRSPRHDVRCAGDVRGPRPPLTPRAHRFGCWGRRPSVFRGASCLRDGRSAGRRERGGVTGRRRRQESKRRLLLRGADRAATGVARTNGAICESGRIINLQSTLTDLAADALKPSHLKTRGECRKSGILAESAVIS